MTTQQINQRIAELCGWKSQSHPYYTDGPCWTKGGILCLAIDLPNYYHDLNACAEAIKERILGDADAERAFLKHLNAILDRRADDDAGPVICEYEMAQITTAPDELCEAFLRVHGKWEE